MEADRLEREPPMVAWKGQSPARNSVLFFAVVGLAWPTQSHPLGSSLPRLRGVFVNMLGAPAVAKTPIPVGETNG
jgi:hypothetical protein